MTANQMSATSCIASSIPALEFNEALLDTLTLTKKSYSISCCLTSHLSHYDTHGNNLRSSVAKPVPWPKNPRDEVDVMEKARSVGINVPAVPRISCPRGNYFIIMDRMQRETLEQLWPRLGLWAIIRIAWQLRSFVSALRTVTSQKTGG